MASSLISSSLHIDFDSVFGIDDAGLVQMFESFIATGLKDFLGCPAVFYEAALTEFFKNGLVRDGMVVSTIGGTTVEISEEIFAAAFVLPTKGLADLSEVPKYLVFDARSLFSESKEKVSISYHKREMKIEYRLLSDILAKTIYVKAGSFDAVTRERFLLMTAITFDVKVNWSRLLFDVLKDMVTPGSRQAKVILTEKKVHRYVVINEKVGAEEVVDAPKVKKAPKAKAASKKRPADVPIVEESKEATSAAPIDEEISTEEQSAVEVAVVTDVQEPAVEHADEQVAETTADEETTVKDVEMIDEPVSLPAEAAVVNKDVYTADDVDVIIEQVLAETVHIGADEEEQDVDTSDVGDKTAETTDGEKHWFDLSYEAIMAQMDAERPVVTPSDTDEEMESIDVGTDFGDQQLQTDVAADSRTDSAADLFVEEPMDDVEMTADEQSVGERTDADEAMSLEDIILSIPVDVPLPYACVEITNITLGKDIKIPGVDERTCFKKLPTIKVEDISEKEDQVLYWGETDSTRVALNRKVYILLKYRELLVRKFLESWKLNFVPGEGTSATDLKVIDMLSDLHLYSFSFKKLPTIKVEDISEKEDQVLYWGETDSTRVDLNRKVYILLKYRELLVRKFLESWKLNFVPGEGTSTTDLKVIDMLSDLHLFLLEELKQQTLAHDLRWVRACCSQLFEGRLRTQGAVMTLPDLEVARQRSYADTLPPLSEFFKLMKKRWGDISLFSGLSEADIRGFVSSIASKRTVLRNLQIAHDSAAVAPNVQLLDQFPFSSSSSDDSMHFDAHDAATTSFSLPATATPDVTEALAQLRASIEQIRDRDDCAKLKDTLLLHLHDIENRFTARFDEQDRVLGVLRKDSHNQKHLLSLDIKSSQKQLSPQAATTAIDVVDVRREVKELNEKVTYLDGQVAATRNDLLEFRAKAQESLNHITDQLSELVNYVNQGEKVEAEAEAVKGAVLATGVVIVAIGDNVRTTDILDRISGSMSREGRGRGRREARRNSGNRNSGHSKKR
ncbi:hypothetical protein F511_32621 [Dorcoceras hygrometricum]|uniref:Dystroglycan-like n=1 Tax=Dorcoceras hygrometricum TaxID=472368 RepID=A0A2Z7CU01_9LAMI|nr:hypothetical protein F511_32621 [Dorcoceras hygrometricum]